MKFSKSEIQHFRKLEQQRKTSKLDEALRPHYNKNQNNHPRHVHNINSDGCGPLENWEKNYGTHSHPTKERVPDQRFN
jgi:hypothetical protein